MSQMAMLILLFLVLVVAPQYSTLALSENDDKSPTPPPIPSLFAPPPPYRPSFNPESPIPNNNNNKPPPIFEYFKLAKVWAPTFCKSNDCTKITIPLDFSLHGLWPQNNSDPQPINCASTHSLNWAQLEKDSPDVVKKLPKYWPYLSKEKTADDVEFWIHEWTDHGKCAANMSPGDYFNLAMELSQKLNDLKDLKAILQKAGITPGNNQMVDSRDVFNTIKKDISAPEIVCEVKGKNYYLKEIRICLDKSGARYIDCVPGTPNGRLNKCRKMVTFPK